MTLCYTFHPEKTISHTFRLNKQLDELLTVLVNLLDTCKNAASKTLVTLKPAFLAITIILFKKKLNRSVFKLLPDNQERSLLALPMSLWHFICIFQSCPRIEPYWKMVHNLLQTLFDSGFPFTPKLFLLGLPSSKLSKLQKKLLRHVIMAARCPVALNWKKREPPSQATLYVRIKDVELMELLMARLNNTVQKHSAIWEVWHLHDAAHQIQIFEFIISWATAGSQLCWTRALYLFLGLVFSFLTFSVFRLVPREFILLVDIIHYTLFFVFISLLIV